MKTNFFLDLEGTIIQSWDNPNLINVDSIKKWLKDRDVKQIHIFSFAIFNKDDQDKFVARFKTPLQDVLGVDIVSWPDKRSMMDADLPIKWDNEWDFSSVRGKQGAFLIWATQNFAGQHSVLIDDCVPNRVVSDLDTNTIITTINVNKVIKDQ